MRHDVFLSLTALSEAAGTLPVNNADVKTFSLTFAETSSVLQCSELLEWFSLLIP